MVHDNKLFFCISFRPVTAMALDSLTIKKQMMRHEPFRLLMGCRSKTNGSRFLMPGHQAKIAKKLTFMLLICQGEGSLVYKYFLEIVLIDHSFLGMLTKTS
jgi:hypothetical protein